jgi:hypothetical protein
MESLFAIGLGLAVRILLDVVSQHDFRVGGSLVGLWEGVVLYHFVEKMPKSHDPYVAYGVRLFVDFLFTESLFRMALVILWTGLGMVLSEIAPVFWYDVGLRHVVRRLRRDMSLLGIPSISFFSKAPIGSSRVRFHSPSRESVHSQASVQSTPSTAAPSNATSSSTPTITPSRQKARRVPGFFPDDCSETTDASSVRNSSQHPPSEPDSDGHSSPSNGQAQIEEIEETDDGFVIVPQMEQDALSETNESDTSTDSDPSATNPGDIPEEDNLQDDDEDNNLTPTMKNLGLPSIDVELAAENQEVDEVLPLHADVPVIPDEGKETEEQSPETTQTRGGAPADPTSQSAAHATAADERPSGVRATTDVTSATVTPPNIQPPAADASTNVTSRAADASVAPSESAPNVAQPTTSQSTIAANRVPIMTPPASPSRVLAGAPNKVGAIANGTATQATDATVNPLPANRSVTPPVDTKRKATVVVGVTTTPPKSSRNVAPAVNTRDSNLGSTAHPAAKGTDSTPPAQLPAPAATPPGNYESTVPASVNVTSAANSLDQSPPVVKTSDITSRTTQVRPPTPPAKDRKPSSQAGDDRTSTANATVQPLQPPVDAAEKTESSPPADVVDTAAATASGQSHVPVVNDSGSSAQVGVDNNSTANVPGQRPASAAENSGSGVQAGVSDSPTANNSVQPPKSATEDPKPSVAADVDDASTANASVQPPEFTTKDPKLGVPVGVDDTLTTNASVQSPSPVAPVPTQADASVQPPATVKDLNNPWVSTTSANAPENSESTDNTVHLPAPGDESSPSAVQEAATTQSTPDPPPLPDKENDTPADQESPTAGQSTFRRPKSRVEKLRGEGVRDSTTTEDSEAPQRDSVLPEGEQAKLDEAIKYRKEARDMDPKIQEAEKAQKEALDDHRIALALLKRREKGTLEEKKQELNKKAERRAFAGKNPHFITWEQLFYLTTIYSTARNDPLDLGRINARDLEPQETVRRILDNMTEVISLQSTGDTTKELQVQLPKGRRKYATAMNAIRVALEA